MSIERLGIRLPAIHNRERNTAWTYQDRKILHQLWRRRLAGESTADLAAELDIQSQGLRQQWRKLGYDPSEVRRKQEAEEVYERDREVYLMRVKDGLTYAQCCLRLGMEPTHSNKTKLRNTLTKFCKANEVPYPGRESADDRNAFVYQMRLEGRSYYNIAEELGLDTTPKVRRKLYSSLRYYCMKKGLEFPKTRTKT